VISGFLKTGIVARCLGKNNFSFIDFYLARARRIIPALFFLVVVLLVIGWFYLSPVDYAQFAREFARSLLFLSNNYFYKKSVILI
jgi:peptidoglycan/LPS O-acetylase OafA/YrhL